MKQIISLLLIILMLPYNAFARECRLPDKWGSLCDILEKRIAQTPLKMKLQEAEVAEIEMFLHKSNFHFKHFYRLQIFPIISTMGKTAFLSFLPVNIFQGFFHTILPFFFFSHFYHR